MKKFLKFLLWVLGGLIALAILAVVLVMLFVDPNDYKDEIAKLVKDKTGRDLTFQGDISLTFFPWLGVEMDGASLSNAPGFGDEPMAVIGRAGASVRILPLLSGDLEIGVVRLKDVRLNLALDEEGAANWDDLLASGEPGAQDAAQPSPDQDESGDNGGFALRLGGVEVENLALVFDDQQSDRRYEVGELALNVGEVAPGVPFDFELTALAQASDPAVSARTTLSGRAGLDLEAGLYEVTGLTLKVLATGDGVPGGQAELDLAADAARLDLAEDKAELERFTLNAYGAAASGFLSVSDLFVGAGEGEFTAAGAVEVAPCNAKEVLAALGLGPVETTDPEALTRVAVSAQFAFRSNVLTADKVELALDQTSVKASMSATDLGGVPAYSFVAVVDDIDLDRYLPPGNGDGGDEGEPAEQAPDNGEGGENGGEVQPASPVEALRTLTLDGQASVGRLKLAGGEFTDITLTVTAKDGVFELEPVGMSFYGGDVEAAFRMDAGPAEPVSGLDLTLTNVNIGQALKAMTGRAYISGVMNLTTTRTLTFEGLDDKRIRQTLAGGFDFTARNGSLPSDGVAADILNLASAVLFTSGSTTRGEDISYDSITATSGIDQGVIRNDYLILKSPSLWARGAGLINLNALTIDYQAAAKIVSNPDPDEKFDDVTAPEVAVYATGPLADPEVDTGVLKGLGNLGLNIVEGVGEGTFDVIEDVGEGALDVLEDIGKSLGIEF